MSEACEDPLTEIQVLRVYLENNKPKFVKESTSAASRSAAANNKRVVSETSQNLVGPPK